MALDISTAITEIAKLYVATFNRAPDTSGLAYWVDAAVNKGVSIDTIANSFFLSTETINLYGTKTNSELVQAVYQNTLGRAVESTDVLNYWTNLLDTGAIQRGSFIQEIVDAASSNGSADGTMLANKTAVGVAYAISNVGGSMTAQSVLAGVTADTATKDAAIAAIEAVANTVDLTVNADNLTGNVFNAARVYVPGGNDQENSLQDDDALTGTGTNPTLNLTLVVPTDTAEDLITPTLNNIQTINIVDTDMDAPNLDLQDASGLINLNIERMDNANARNINNMPGTAVNLSVDGTGATIASLDMNYDRDVTTIDTINLELADITATDFIRVEEGTTVNLEVSGAAVTIADLRLDSTATLNVSGDQNLTLTNMTLSDGVLATLDASDLTGAIDVDLGLSNIIEARVAGSSGTDVDFTFTGGSGNDSVTVDEASLVAATAGEDADGHDVIDGGTGTNALIFSVTNTDANLTDEDVTISNMQDVTISALGDNAADTFGLDTSLVGGITTLTMVNADTATAEVAAFDIYNVSAALGASGLKVQHASLNANATAAANTDVEIDLADASGANDTVAVEIIAGENTTETFNFTLDVDGESATGVANGGAVENITITDSDNEDNTVNIVTVAQHTGTVTLTGGRADDAFTVTGDVVAGDVVATAQLSDVRIAVGTEDQDIAMGSGDDVVTFSNLNDLDENDTVDGGAGDDIIRAAYNAPTATDIDDLDIAGFETFSVASQTTIAIEFDDSEADTITKIQLMGDDFADTYVASLAVATTDIITIEADNVATIEYLDDSTTAAASVFNGITLDGGNVETLTMVVNNLDTNTGGATAGLVTADNVETLTIDVNTAHANADLTFNGITMTSLTSLTAVTGASGVGGDLTLGTVTSGSMTTVNATGVVGAFSATFTGMANSSTVTLGDGNNVVSVAGSTGTGITITGGTGNDTLTGSAQNDTIAADNGNNTVTGGAGNDTISVGTGTDGITAGSGDDTITLAADTAVDTLNFTTNSGLDRIAGFDTTEDKLSFDGVVTGLTTTVGTAVTSGSLAAAALLTSNTVNVISDGATALTAVGTQSIADYTDLVDVAAYLNEGYTATAAGDAAVFVINDLVADKTYVYTFLEVGAGASTISSAELTLIGIITEESGAAIVAGDIA